MKSPALKNLENVRDTLGTRNKIRELFEELTEEWDNIQQNDIISWGTEGLEEVRKARNGPTHY